MPQEASGLNVPIKSCPASYLSANGCLARGVKADGRGTPPTWILAGIPQVQTCCRSRHTGPKESHMFRFGRHTRATGQQDAQMASQLFLLSEKSNRSVHPRSHGLKEGITTYTPRLRTISRSVPRTSNAHGSLVNRVLCHTILFKDPFRAHRLTIQCPFQTLVHVRSILIQGNGL